MTATTKKEERDKKPRSSVAWRSFSKLRNRLCRPAVGKPPYDIPNDEEIS